MDEYKKVIIFIGSNLCPVKDTLLPEYTVSYCSKRQ